MKFIVLFIFLVSCNIPLDQKKAGDLDFNQEDHGESTREVVEEESETPAVKISFEQIKTQILESKCLGCHRSMGDEKKLVNFIESGKPEISSLYIAVDSGRMPPFGGRLSQGEVDLIKQYILDAVR